MEFDLHYLIFDYMQIIVWFIESHTAIIIITILTYYQYYKPIWSIKVDAGREFYSSGIICTVNW